MRGTKPTIRSGNQIERQRVALLAALRSFHDAERDTVARAIEKVAQDIAAGYRKRHADGAPLDFDLVEQAVTSRDELKKARAKRKTSELNVGKRRTVAVQELKRLEATARRSDGDSPIAKVGELAGIRGEIELRLERLDGATRELERRDTEAGRRFLNATAAARCEPDLNGDDLDSALLRAKAGTREFSVETWDIAELIWQRFGGTIYAGGFRDDGSLFDDRSDAIGCTIFVRAALSRFKEDDLLAPALLRFGVDEPENYRRCDHFTSQLSTHRFVLGVPWHGIIGQELSPALDPFQFMRGESSRLAKLGLDVRVAWLIQTGEAALDAATGVCEPVEARVVAGAPGPRTGSSVVPTTSTGVDYLSRTDDAQERRRVHLRTRQLSREARRRCEQVLAELEQFQDDPVVRADIEQVGLSFNTLRPHVVALPGLPSLDGTIKAVPWSDLVRFVVEGWRPRCRRRKTSSG